MRQVILYQDEDGLWIAECPSLPGCFSDGATQGEALDHIKVAIELWIEASFARGESIPDDPEIHLMTVEVANPMGTVDRIIEETSLSELTVGELRKLIKDTMREEMEALLDERAAKPTEPTAKVPEEPPAIEE